MGTIRTGIASLAAAVLCALPLMVPAAIAAASSPGAAPKAGETVVAVEFHHAAMDHYFVSTDPVEINALDTHYFVGWERTGRQFNVFPLGATGRAPTCRFFSTSFGIKSSHFYTANDAECEYVKLNPNWQFEGERFSVALPDGAGNCPAGTVPLYRLYNNGQGGAPNHRFVTSPADRQAMLGLGYSDEGVAMCVAPPTVVAGTAEGKWHGTTSNQQVVDLWVLSDGTYYAVYGQPSNAIDSGAVSGTSTSANGVFQSVDAKEYPFRREPAFMLVAPPALQSASGTFVPKQSMQLTIGGRSVSLAYDATYDHQASRAELQGSYGGNGGHFADPHDGATAVFDANGNFSLTSTECLASGVLTPRGLVNVFDAGVIGTALNCSAAMPTITPGIAFYDSATHAFRLFVKFLGGADMWFFVGGK